MAETNVNKVEEKLQNMDGDQKEQILSSFQEFKDYLGDKVSKGEKLGLNEEQLAKTAEKVASYLAKHEEPRNREEKLLQELWKVGDKDEQHKLAHLLVKLVG
ncbi:DUF3243 domain-containing protein [Actinomycetes bacterium NPDC127524]|uniref:DUF3243 domain-containing protein n=1 Tax=unclassified Bacillus (in: firmicutes) TaxID=185979 RepID=UPI0008E42F03|nr:MULTISPECIES: DUF3243 domain-containing protein [unclassified Bacillus (in: firmicutes)]OIK11247.1 hypothetical protein BIV59_12700 [Bacillus sp. MUM 13]SFC29086.1 Protein of unknown function [Bacillus sp. OV322]